MPVYVGTSGWQYADWRGRLYPATLPQRRWLEHYASLYATTEVNNTFYRLPEASTFASWASRTPDDFVFAVKASRYLTHVRRLREPAEAVSRLMDRCRLLGRKLGPVLLQLPPTMPASREALDRLDATLAAFPSGVRVVVEPRDESWHGEDTAALLSARDVALCLFDSPRRRAPSARTASFGYVRFHEGSGRPRPCYRPSDLRSWAERLAQSYAPADEVYAYFNNDTHACAPRDAVRFAAALREVGLVPTRVPPPRSLRTIGLGR